MIYLLEPCFSLLGLQGHSFTIVQVVLELCQVPSLWILTLLAELLAEIFQEACQKPPFILYAVKHMPILLGFWELGACGCGRHLWGNAQPIRPFYPSTAPVEVGV